MPAPASRHAVTARAHAHAPLRTRWRARSRADLRPQIRTLCLSPDGRLLLAIDEDGRALLINRRRRVLLHRFAFKAPVAAARFSPDGRFIGAAVGRLLQVRPALRACTARPTSWAPLNFQPRIRVFRNQLASRGPWASAKRPERRRVHLA